MEVAAQTNYDNITKSTLEVSNNTIKDQNKSRFKIVKLPVTNKISRFTEVCNDRDDDKQQFNINSIYERKIMPMLKALTPIKDSSKYLNFIEKYQQDFKATCKILKSHIKNTPNLYKDYNNNSINAAKLAIILTKLTMVCTNYDMKNLIQSFQVQVDYAKLYFDNPYAIKFIEENYDNLRDIIKLIQAIAFYSILDNNTDEACVFCQKLSKFIRKSRSFVAIPDIVNIISDICMWKSKIQNFSKLL